MKVVLAVKVVIDTLATRSVFEERRESWRVEDEKERKKKNIRTVILVNRRSSKLSRNS